MHVARQTHGAEELHGGLWGTTHMGVRATTHDDQALHGTDASVDSVEAAKTRRQTTVQCTQQLTFSGDMFTATSTRTNPTQPGS